MAIFYFSDVLRKVGLKIVDFESVIKQMWYMNIPVIRNLDSAKGTIIG